MKYGADFDSPVGVVPSEKEQVERLTYVNAWRVSNVKIHVDRKRDGRETGGRRE